MQKKLLATSAAVLALMFTVSGCGSDDSRGSEQGLPELESHGKTLMFYNASDNSQYGYIVEDGRVLNIQDPNLDYEENLSKMIMKNGEKGKYFEWTYDRGDQNASNDVDIVMMMHAEYPYGDRNATYEDFYYLTHLTNEGYLHPHANTEFISNDPQDSAYKKMVAFNESLAAHHEKGQEIETKLSEKGAQLCGWHKFEAKFGTYYFAAGTNGRMYVYDNNLSYKDSYTMDGVSSCEADKHGFSSAADGVLFFSAETQSLHLVDSHDNGNEWHEHAVFPLDQILGAGKTATTMTSLGEVEEHDHDEE